MTQFNTHPSLKLVLLLACLFAIIGITLNGSPTGASNPGKSTATKQIQFNGNNVAVESKGGRIELASANSGASNRALGPLAGSITVNSTSDATNVGDGLCTLREAITAANNDTASGGAAGECAAGSGTDTITITPTGTINLTSMLPDITSNMTINGPGSGLLTLRRDTGGEYTVLTVINTTAVSISGITVTNGRAPEQSRAGGGISNTGDLTLTDVVVTGNRTEDGFAGGSDGGYGGGIQNNNVLVMVNCVVSGNSTGNGSSGGPGGNGAGGRGGGIVSGGVLTMIGSVVSGNTTGIGAGATSGGDGGGIYSAGEATLINSTVSNNVASAEGFAGGIWASGSFLTLTNTTVTGNSAGSNPGIFINGATVTLRNTIVAGNGGGGTGPDVSGSCNSLGHNLIGNGDTSFGFTNGSNGDQVGTTAAPINPLLGPLGNHGGPTQTHALLGGSLAIDAGDNCVLTNSCSPALASALTTDQRGAGFDRGTDGDGNGTSTVDIGAYEVQAIVVTNISDSGPGSLRQALIDTNANSDNKAITFQTGLTGTINVNSALPDLSTSMSINGPGASILTIGRNPAAPQFRVFTISGGATVAISGLTIAGGNGGASNGGGIMNSGTLALINTLVTQNTAGSGLSSGGGIFNNFGTLNIINSTISGNTANTSNGGGIYVNGGTVNLTNSTVSGNSTNGGGGGILNGGTFNITNSTLSGNTATNGGGGGILNQTAGVITITSSTISGNTAGEAGGIINTGGGTVAFGNTVIANNISSFNADLKGPFNSNGFNLLRDTAGATISDSQNPGTNILGQDPKLGALANNGGPTQTHTLLAGSPALDAGDDSVTGAPLNLSTDQRGSGFSRQVDGPDADTIAKVDIGAYEAQVSVEDITDKSTNKDTQLQFAFNVGGSASITSVTAISSNTTLVPNNPANIAVSGSGSTRTLTINPIPNQVGTSTITVTVNGSNSQMMGDTFLLTVNSVNHAPSFTKGPDQTVNENTQSQTVNNWATSISPGPADESGQTVTFIVTNNSNPALFATGPVISSSGTLTYTPSAGASGTANITIALMDNGGTANGGNDTSPTQPFNITVREGGNLSFSSATYAIGEGGASTVITVNRTGGSAGEARVNYATSNGTATAGQDYTAASGTLIFADGITTQSFNVTITNDALDESDETINLTLTAPAGSGSLGAPASAVLTINDNDPAPAISINDVAVTEGNSGAVNATFTVSLSGQSGQTVTVNFATANDTATAGTDYQAKSGTVTFLALDTTETATVTINGDFSFEPNETFFVNLSAATNATISDNQGLGTINNDDSSGGTLAFASPTFTVTEIAGSILISVNRNGDTTQAVTVDYATANVTADGRKDYIPARGTLHFDAGVPARAFPVLVNIDAFNEGSELVELTLSNATGGAALGVPSTASLQIDNSPWTSPPANSIDDAETFVRQHYHDFLNRDASNDPAGLAFWTNQITECQQPGATCNAEVRRINVSAAFFVSIEFQQTGYLVYRFYKAGYGNLPGAPVPLTLGEFLPDTQQIGRDVIVGVGNWQTQLENNKAAYALDFVSRLRFTLAYPTTLTPEQLVDALFTQAGVTPSATDRDAAVNEFGGAGNTADTAARGRALRRVAENSILAQQEFNRAFVLMEYFGYLRRNPNDAPEPGLNFDGYNFWLGKLIQFNGDYISAEMVKAFINSSEYRNRFGL